MLLKVNNDNKKKENSDDNYNNDITIIDNFNV